MHNAKSYMVPKMIFANVLAVIMMTFEQPAPADVKEKPQKVMGRQTSQSDSVLQVSASKDVADQPVVERAVAKKRMHNTQHKGKTPHTQFVNGKSAPIDCCFRGYKS